MPFINQLSTISECKLHLHKPVNKISCYFRTLTKNKQGGGDDLFGIIDFYIRKNST